MTINIDNRQIMYGRWEEVVVYPGDNKAALEGALDKL
jgi:hypothetical protein